MNTQQEKNHDHSDIDRNAVESIRQSIVDLGTEWAVLGISFGTQALERSAQSLTLVAKTLSTLSEALERKARGGEKKVEEPTDVIDAPAVSENDPLDPDQA